MCLRTHRWLELSDATTPGEYLCPGHGEGCTGGETYAAQVAETEAGAAVLGAMAFLPAGARAGVPDGLSVWLVRPNGSAGPAALLPESTLDRTGRPAIYLTGSGPYQLAYQAAHEVFHVAFTPIETRDWRHEVDAVAFSLAYLEAAGAGGRGYREYRAALIDRASRRAAGFSAEDLMHADQPYPDGFYDRAILLAVESALTAGGGEA